LAARIYPQLFTYGLKCRTLFLGAFAKLRKVNISLVVYVRPHGTSGFPFMFLVPCITNLYYKCPTRCNNKQSVFCFTARSLYIFRVPFTPIVRSTWNCSYSHWYKSYISV